MKTKRLRAPNIRSIVGRWTSREGRALPEIERRRNYGRVVLKPAKDRFSLQKTKRKWKT